jgi:hypothetical protein
VANPQSPAATVGTTGVSSCSTGRGSPLSRRVHTDSRAVTLGATRARASLGCSCHYCAVCQRESTTASLPPASDPGQHDQTRSMRPRVQGDGPLFKLPVQGRLPYSKCSIVLAITCPPPARSRRGRRPRLLQTSFALADASLLSTDDWKYALSGLLRYVRNRHLRSVFHRLQRQAS